MSVWEIILSWRWVRGVWKPSWMWIERLVGEYLRRVSGRCSSCNCSHHLWNSMSTNLRSFSQLQSSPAITISSLTSLPFNAHSCNQFLFCLSYLLILPLTNLTYPTLLVDQLCMSNHKCALKSTPISICFAGATYTVLLTYLIGSNRLFGQLNVKDINSLGDEHHSYSPGFE